MRRKVINSFIILFGSFMILCTLYTTVMKYWYMPVISQANSSDCVIASKAFPYVIPNQSINSESGKSYVYVIESTMNVLGFRSIVRKVPIKILAVDKGQCAVKLINYEISGSSFSVVKKTTGKLYDQTEVQFELN